MSLLTASWLTDLALLLVTLFSAVYLFYQRKFQHWSRKKIPHTAPVFIFGDLKDVNRTRSLGMIISDIYLRGQGQKYVGCWKFFTPTFIPRDLNLIRNILIKDFEYFHDRGLGLNEKVEPLAGHLFLLKGKKWKNMRAKLSPTFTSGKMKMMFSTMVDCGESLVEYLNVAAKNKEVIEVKEIMSRFTMDIIASCAFGIEVNCMQNPDVKFRTLGQELFRPNFLQAVRNILLFSCPGIFEFIRIGIFTKETREFFTGVVRDTMKYREENNVTRNDFLQLLLELKNKGYVAGEGVDIDSNTPVPDGEKFTLQVATAQSFVFFVAGFETASTLLQYILYELARNQDVQQKTRDEIQRVLKNYKGELTYEAVQDMEYLDRVVAETLRLYPVAPMLLRQVTKDYQIPGTDVILDKGTDLFIPIYGIHHDPEYYPDPERFDPDRFLPEVKAKRDHYAYMPFGEGPRQCIGMRFALMQTKVGLINSLNTFRFDVCEQTQVQLKFDPKTTVLQILGGIHLRISESQQ